MKIIITGATSKIGKELLIRLQDNKNIKEIVCISRKKLFLEKNFKVKSVVFDLTTGATAFNIDLIKNFDCCIHLAALTHEGDREDYFQTNVHGTKTILKIAKKSKVSKFIFISSYTAGVNSGDYAESKFFSEKEVLKAEFQSCLILRPSEIVGLSSTEGLDKFESLAKKKKVYPVLCISYFPLKFINFNPIRYDYFVDYLVKETISFEKGQKIISVLGKQKSSFEIFRSLSKFVIPIFLSLKILTLLSYLPILKNKIRLEQIKRLKGERNQVHSESQKIVTVVIP